MTQVSSNRPLRDPALRPVVLVVAQRLEQRGLVPSGRLTISGLDRGGRQALGQLLGRHLTRDRVQLDLGELDAIVRDRLAMSGGLVAACEDALGRRLIDRPLAREHARRARDEPIETMRSGIAYWATEPAWASEWVSDVSRLGLLARTADPVSTAEQAVRLVGLLATPGETAIDSSPLPSRNELAARELGNAHALDDGTALAAIVARGLALAAGLPPPTTPRERRELWQAFGVEHDQVSTTALVLGLRSTADDALSARLSLAAGDGDPLHLTARNVAGLSAEDLVASRVLVCENPRVLEVAASIRHPRAVLVCTMGSPATVVVDLLRKLADAGSALDYHGDFDWPGLAITTRVVEATGARPWCMQADNYLAAVAAARGHLKLEGTSVPSPWDPNLSEAMAATDLAVHEEALLPGLILDWLEWSDSLFA